jgi:hypothetical protein
MFYLYALIVLGAGFAIAWFLSHRATVLLGNVDFYGRLKWLFVLSLAVGIPVILWRFLVGMMFFAASYCIIAAIAAVRIHALRLPSAAGSWCLIGALISRSLGIATFTAMWATRFWSLIGVSGLHLGA